MRFWRNLRFRGEHAADQKRTSFTRLRYLLFFVNFIKWSSACIVMAIASYFIHDFTRDGSTTFQEIIACTSIGFFLPTMPLAFYKRVTLHLVPIDYIYSHLWVTAFIFAALDYNKNDCSTHSPARLHSCRLKYALESWCIIAVSFCVFATILQVLIYRSERGISTSLHSKELHASAERTENGVEPIIATSAEQA